MSLPRNRANKRGPERGLSFSEGATNAVGHATSVPPPGMMVNSRILTDRDARDRER
jgi:hypothetical protein